jgi:molybdopterin converting factor small subunit
MPRFEILMFAAARDLVGSDELYVEATEPITAGELLRRIGETAPGLLPMLPACRLAVDQSFVPDDFCLRPGVELALIPPVSGG